MKLKNNPENKPKPMKVDVKPLSREMRVEIPLLTAVCIGTACRGYRKGLCNNWLCPIEKAEWLVSRKHNIEVELYGLFLGPGDDLPGQDVSKLEEIRAELAKRLDDLEKLSSKFAQSRWEFRACSHLKTFAKEVNLSLEHLKKLPTACQGDPDRCLAFYDDYGRLLARFNAIIKDLIIYLEERGFVEILPGSTPVSLAIVGPGTTSTVSGISFVREFERSRTWKARLGGVSMKLVILPSFEDLKNAPNPHGIEKRLEMLLRGESGIPGIYAVNTVVGFESLSNGAVGSSPKEPEETERKRISEKILDIIQRITGSKELGKETNRTPQEFINRVLRISHHIHDRDKFDYAVGRLVRTIVLFSSIPAKTDAVLCRDITELLSNPRVYIAGQVVDYAAVASGEDIIRQVLWPTSDIKGSIGLIGVSTEYARERFPCGVDTFIKKSYSTQLFSLIRTSQKVIDNTYYEYIRQAKEEEERRGGAPV